MIRGQKRPLPIRHVVKSNVEMNIHNRFDIEVIDSETGKIKQKAQAENIVLNQLWATHFFTKWNAVLHFGSGAGEPTSADTQLFNYVGSKSLTDPQFSYDEANFIAKCTSKITLSDTENVGLVLSEVGVAPRSAQTTLCTHAMIKDMNGNQITITKTNTDIINIYATVFAHADGIKNYFNVSNVYSAFKRTFNVALGRQAADYTSDNFLVCRGRDGYTHDASKLLSSNGVIKDYVTRKLTFKFARIGADKGNYDGLYALGLRTYDGDVWSYYFEFNMLPPIWAGTDVVGEAIGTGDGSTKSFKTAFVDVTNCKIYVDGAEQTTGVTITKTTAVTNNIVFDIAPSIGAVITGDYHTPDIAKDINHVFDFEVSFQFGEYTP